MSDYIDRQAVIALVKDIVVPTNKGEYRHRCIDPYDVYELRPADVEPVRHGRWKEDEESLNMYCTACNHRASVKWDFCPWCGARMDGDIDG